MALHAAFASHSPVMSMRSPGPDIEREFQAAADRMRAAVTAFDPELVILFGTDHFYGFFYDTMPSFCIGMRAASAAEYGMPAGGLSVPEEIAARLTGEIRDADIDIAHSYNMVVDHGFTHTLQMLFGGLDKVLVVPIFINCAAPPFPSLARVQKLGQTVGRFADKLGQRVLVVASGGLSHDPPTPQIASAPPDVLGAILSGGRTLTDEIRELRLRRILDVADKIAKHEIASRPLSPDWDREFMDRLVTGNLDSVMALSDAEIDEAAGRGAQEIRTWLAAEAAVRATNGRAEASHSYYRAIPEWLCGMGLLYLMPANT